MTPERSSTSEHLITAMAPNHAFLIKGWIINRQSMFICLDVLLVETFDRTLEITSSAFICMFLRHVKSTITQQVYGLNRIALNKSPFRHTHPWTPNYPPNLWTSQPPNLRTSKLSPRNPKNFQKISKNFQKKIFFFIFSKKSQLARIWSHGKKSLPIFIVSYALIFSFRGKNETMFQIYLLKFRHPLWR